MIRKLLKSDYNNYLKLINKFRNTNFTQTQFEEVLTNLENTNNFIWVYEYDNILIGTAKLIVETKFIFNISYVAHIEDVFVDNDYRNKNIGKSMVLHLINEANKFNCYKIICVCLEETTNFYIKCGLEKRGCFMSKLLINV